MYMQYLGVLMIMVILFTNKNWASVKTWSVKDLPNAAGTNPGKDQQNLHCLLHRPWLLIPRTVPRPPAVIQRILTAAVSRPTSLSAPSGDTSSLLDIWTSRVRIGLCSRGYKSVYLCEDQGGGKYLPRLNTGLSSSSGNGIGNIPWPVRATDFSRKTFPFGDEEHPYF